MGPFWDIPPGSCQFAEILVELLTVKPRFVGACEGTENGKSKGDFYHDEIWLQLPGDISFLHSCLIL